MPPASTIMEHTPPAKRTLPATIKECVMRTRHPRSGGAQGVDGRKGAWRSGAPGPHAHGNVGRQVVGDRRAEVCGQRKPLNAPPRRNQHSPGTPTTGHRERTNGTRRNQHSPGTPTTALRETTPAGAQAAAADKNTATRRSPRKETATRRKVPHHPPHPPTPPSPLKTLGQIFFRAFGQSNIFFGASKNSAPLGGGGGGFEGAGPAPLKGAHLPYTPLATPPPLLGGGNGHLGQKA